MGKVRVVLVGIVVWVEYWVWLGKKGIDEYRGVNDDVGGEEGRKGKVKGGKDEVFGEIEDVNGGEEGVEEGGGNEVRMRRGGESFYGVVGEGWKGGECGGEKNG